MQLANLGPLLWELIIVIPDHTGTKKGMREFCMYSVSEKERK